MCYSLITLYNQQTAIDFKLNKTEFNGKHISDLLKIDHNQIELLKTLETGKDYGIINSRIILNDKKGPLL
jgi:hypothetical protein